MLKFTNKIRSKHNKKLKLLATGIILVELILIISLYSIPITPNVQISKAPFSENGLNLANGDSLLFEGTEPALNITDFGNLYKTNQEVILTNDAELNLTYYIDDVHDWKASKIDTSITNIQDTREWVNNSDFLPITSYIVYETHESGHSYTKNYDRGDSLDTITQSDAIAMRVHFTDFSFEEDWDFFFIEDEYGVIYYTDTGEGKSDFFSPWIRGTELNCYYESDGNFEFYGYEIDYYEFVNSSSNYNVNANDWGFYSDATTEVNYGTGNVDGADAMFVALNAELSPDGDYWDAKYYNNDYAELYQDITIPRGQIIDGYFSFDYYAEFAMNSNENDIFIKINDQRIYSKGIGNVVDLGRDTWHSTGKIYMGLWSNTTDIFDNIRDDDSFNISIGVRSGATITYGGFDELFQQVFWFDNISLVLTTIANSSQSDISLTLNHESLDSGIQWGTASKLFTGLWDVNPIILTVNTTAPSLSFNINTTIYGHHNTTSRIGQSAIEGMSYEILENGSVYWEFYHNFYMPSQYEGFEFIIQKPENWNFISVLDPTLQTRSFEQGLTGGVILKINSSNAIFPGWWTFRATSPNYLDNSNTKMLKQGDWGYHSFLTGESTRVKTQINNSNEIPPNLISTQANLTIFDPDGSIWYQESKNPMSNGTVIFSEIMFSALNTTGGQFNYTLFWSNGTSLGGIKSEFTIIHESSMTLLKPSDATADLVTEAFVGDIIPLRVKLFDFENNESISEAIISYNWTSGTEYFEEAALGIYEVILDTVDLGSNGFYEIVIESTKIGFENSTLTLRINLGEETNLQRLQSDYSIEMHSNSTIKFRYLSEFDGSGIDGANIELNISNPDLYTITNTINGYYDIEFDTSFINNLGIYQLNFNFTAPAYETQSHVYQFEIIEQSVNLSVLIDSQEIMENALLELMFKQEITISVRALANSEMSYISGGNITWNSNNYYSSMIEGGNYWYNQSITFSTSNFSSGINNIYLSFEKDNYQNTIFAFQILLTEQDVNLTVYINNQEISENALIELMFKQNITVSARAFATGEMDYISGAVITWNSGNYYNSLIEYGNYWYNLTIVFSSINFSSGINTVYLRFEKGNYTDEVFSFQLLLTEQAVDLTVRINNQEILENTLLELMFKENITISTRAFATSEMIYISGGLITWNSDNYYNTLTEYGNYWYNLSIVFSAANFSAGINTVYLRFEKGNYTEEAFSFQILMTEQAVDLTVSVNNQEISENTLLELMFKQNITISTRGFATAEMIYLTGGTVTWNSDNYYNTLIEQGNYWYNLTIVFSAANFSNGVNTVYLRFEKGNYTDEVFSFQVLLTEQEVDLMVYVNDQMIAENSLIELMFKENITISTRAFATAEMIYLSGGNVSWNSDYYLDIFMELPNYWYNLTFTISGTNFELGINSIYIKFEKGNYTDEIFSFQLLLTAQSVDLELYVDSQEISENSLIELNFYETLNLSSRVFANAELIYLSGGTITFISSSFTMNFTENVSTWYESTILCAPENFTFGINYVYIKFQHANYTSQTFGFQLLIDQIEIEVEPVGFDDSINAETGETITLQITLLDPQTDGNIENATVSYSWLYGVGVLNEISPGVYQTQIKLPDNVQGNFRFTFVISTQETVYKTTEYSFLLIVGTPGIPPYLIWIIIGASAAAIGVLGILSVRSYVILPRKRKKAAKMLSMTQRYKDMRNLQAIVVIHRLSGIPIYTKNYALLEKHKKELFSGFIQAITTIGEEIAGKDVSGETDENEQLSVHNQKIQELDFNQFNCLIFDNGDVRTVLILSEKASERMKEQISNFGLALNLKLGQQLERWDGSLDKFEQLIPPIVEEYFELYYKEGFQLAPPEYIAQIRTEQEFSKMETRILNVTYSVAKGKNEFFLEYVLELIHEADKDKVIIAIEALTEKGILIPVQK